MRRQLPYAGSPTQGKLAQEGSKDLSSGSGLSLAKVNSIEQTSCSSSSHSSRQSCRAIIKMKNKFDRSIDLNPNSPVSSETLALNDNNRPSRPSTSRVHRRPLRWCRIREATHFQCVRVVRTLGSFGSIATERWNDDIAVRCWPSWLRWRMPFANAFPLGSTYLHRARPPYGCANIENTHFRYRARNGPDHRTHCAKEEDKQNVDNFFLAVQLGIKLGK